MIDPPKHPILRAYCEGWRAYEKGLPRMTFRYEGPRLEAFLMGWSEAHADDWSPIPLKELSP